MKKTLYFLLLLACVACKRETIPDPEIELPHLPELSFDSDANSTLMFKDGEPLDTMTAETRRYEIGKVLRVKAINTQYIEISNFAPIDIEQAVIIATINGLSKPVKLISIKKIRAFGKVVVKYPFLTGNPKFFDTSDQEVNLSQFQQLGIPVANIAFDFNGNTELIRKLKTLQKLKWEIKFHDFNPNSDPNANWKIKPVAKDFRRFAGLMINMAYQIGQDASRTEFVKEPIINNDGRLLTTEEKQTVYTNLLNMKTFNCGIVVNVSGLGGGATYGVAEHVLHDYLTMDPSFISFHELGHMLGFSHSSTMTYPVNDQGAVVAMGRVWNAMLTPNTFPLTKDNYLPKADL